MATSPLQTSEVHVQNLLDGAVKGQRSREKRVKYILWSIRISAMALGMISTILLGLTIPNPTFVTLSRNGALFCTAATTFLTALAGFWHLEQYWVESKVLAMKLAMLKQEFEFRRAEGPIDKVQLEDFFGRYQAIMCLEDQYWLSVLAQARTEKRDAQNASTVRAKPHSSAAS